MSKPFKLSSIPTKEQQVFENHRDDYLRYKIQGAAQ
jgi:hypothetical protein